MLLLAVALGVSAGRAETVVCNDGKSYTGAVTVTAHEAVCVTPGVRRQFALTTVKDIELSGPERFEFETRTRKLQPLDAGALVDLGMWLKSKHQLGLAQEHFAKAVNVDANHAAARRELGFERKGLSPASGGLGASAEWVYSPVLHQGAMYGWVGRAALAFHLDLAKKLHELKETALEEKELRRVIQADGINPEAIGMLRPIVAQIKLRNAYRLPFTGTWAAVSGGEGEYGHARYSYMLNAVDFRKVNEQWRTFSGPPGDLKSYCTWNQPIYAPADGEVYEVRSEFPDNPIGGMGALEEGNRIMIRHGSGEYSVVGHLQRGTFKVKSGDKVKQGQLLALMGNSGRSATPHLHFAIYDGDGVSLPIMVTDFDVVDREGRHHVDRGGLQTGKIYANEFGRTPAK